MPTLPITSPLLSASQVWERFGGKYAPDETDEEFWQVESEAAAWIATVLEATPALQDLARRDLNRAILLAARRAVEDVPHLPEDTENFLRYTVENEELDEYLIGCIQSFLCFEMRR